MTSGQRLREAIQAKYSMDEAATSLGMSRNTLYYKTNGEVEEEFVQQVKKALPRIAITDVMTGDTITEEIQSEYSSQKDAMKVILTLSESNAVAIRTNERLAKMLEQDRANSGAGQQKDSTADQVLTGLVKLLAKVAVGNKKWKSEEEFLAYAMNQIYVSPASAGQ